MKPRWILCWGLLVLSWARAEAAYEVTAADRKFLAEVLAAVESKDAAWIAEHTSLPITLIADGGRHLAEKEEFASAVARSLTPELQTRLRSEGKKELFKNWRGVMVGDGIVWFEQVRRSNDSPWEYRILAFGGFAVQPNETN